MWGAWAREPVGPWARGPVSPWARITGLDLPQKSNLFRAKSAKMLYCPKKTKKNQSLESLGSSRAWRSANFGFFGTVQHFCSFWLKSIGFFGTVRHFCSPRPPKCCTVPKKPIFLEQKVQNCCTVPKKPKFGELGLLQGLEVSKLCFFGFFLGQYSMLALFA